MDYYVSNQYRTPLQASLLSTESFAERRSKRKQLPASFIPGEFSVLCGRGKACTASSGNMRLKALINKYLKPYSEAKNKVEKSSIVSVIIAEVKKTAPEGAFIKRENGSWYEVEDAFAREKIGSMFRDILHTQYRSSTKAKLARKKARQRESNNMAFYNMARFSSQNMFNMSLADATFGQPSPTDFNSQYANNNSAVNCGPSMPFQNNNFMSPACRNINDYSQLYSSCPAPLEANREQRTDILDFVSAPCPVPRKSNLNIMSALKSACDIAESSCQEGFSGDLPEDFPDDLSDIFDD